MDDNAADSSLCSRAVAIRSPYAASSVSFTLLACCSASRRRRAVVLVFWGWGKVVRTSSLKQARKRAETCKCQATGNRRVGSVTGNWCSGHQLGKGSIYAGRRRQNDTPLGIACVSLVHSYVEPNILRSHLCPYRFRQRHSPPGNLPLCRRRQLIPVRLCPQLLRLQSTRTGRTQGRW